MTNRIISAVILCSFSYFVVNQFMPLDNKKLPMIADPRLVVKKSERRLEVFDRERLVKSYRIVLGFAPEGGKRQEGDGKTPLGEFYVFTKNEQSKYYLSLGLSYPNIADSARGLRENMISQAENDAIIQAVGEKKMPPQDTKLGGAIYIHCGGTEKDWTRGCIALEDEEMKEIYDAIPLGSMVTIFP